MGMVGCGAEGGMRGVACRVHSTESDVQRAVSIILLINLQLLALSVCALQPIYLEF